MKTICQVCMHHCALEPGQMRVCRARKNEGGEIICDNYGVITSMADAGSLDAEHVSPGQLADIALTWKEQKKAGNIGIAYTYNEPLVGWEFVRDTARVVKSYGMLNVLVTNGTASLQVLGELLPCGTDDAGCAGRK